MIFASTILDHFGIEIFFDAVRSQIDSLKAFGVPWKRVEHSPCGYCVQVAMGHGLCRLQLHRFCVLQC